MARDFDSLIDMFSSMPKGLGYTWTGDEIKQHITLTQASGTLMTVPLDFCETFEV